MGILENLKKFRTGQNDKESVCLREEIVPSAPPMTSGQSTFVLIASFGLMCFSSYWLYDAVYKYMNLTKMDAMQWLNNRLALGFFPILLIISINIFLKLLGYGNQKRFFSPYLYHPYIFYFIGIVFLVLVVYGTLFPHPDAAGRYVSTINQIKLGTAPFLFIGLGKFIALWWKK